MIRRIPPSLSVALVCGLPLLGRADVISINGGPAFDASAPQTFSDAQGTYTVQAVSGPGQYPAGSHFRLEGTFRPHNVANLSITITDNDLRLTPGVYPVSLSGAVAARAATVSAQFEVPGTELDLNAFGSYLTGERATDSAVVTGSFASPPTGYTLLLRGGTSDIGTIDYSFDGTIGAVPLPPVAATGSTLLGGFAVTAAVRRWRCSRDAFV